MYVCMYVCMCAYIHEYIFVCKHDYVCECVQMRKKIRMQVCKHVNARTSIRMKNIAVRMDLPMCARVHALMYIDK